MLQRDLDKREILGMNMPPGALGVEYQGNIDQDALARAFELLGARHPFLRGRIRPEGQGYVLYVPPEHHPEIVVVDGDKEAVKREAAKPLDVKRALAQVVLIRGEMGGFALLRGSRSVFGGANGLGVFDELWRLYAGVVRDPDLLVVPGSSLPESYFEVFRRRGFQLAESHIEPNVRPEFSEVLTRRIALTEADTARLVDAAHAHKTSVHGIVCGAILTAVRDEDESQGPAQMVCISPIDMRNRVTPPVKFTEVTSFGAPHRAQVAVSAHDDPVEVGRQIKRQVDAAIANHQLLDPTRARYVPIETSLKQHLATVWVTNNGVVPRFAEAPGMAIKDFIIADDPTIDLPYPTHSFLTYGGRLKMQAMYSSKFFNGRDADRLAERIAAHLRDVYSLQPA